MRRRRRRRKNTRRAFNKDSEIFAGQLFSCPVFIQNFYCYRKQPPSCTHMRAKRRLSYNRLSYILIQLYFRYPVAKSTTFRYGVPFAHAERFSPAILTIRSNVSGRKKFPAT